MSQPPTTPEDVATVDDVDLLWQALRAARADDDHELVRAIEGRMRELSTGRRFAHLSDEELEQRIASLRERRGAEDMIAHSPGGSGMEGDSRHLTGINQAIRDNQHAGIEETLSALLDEQDRRRQRT